MLNGSQIVNGLGHYLKRHLTGAGNIEKGSNSCKVIIPLSYIVKPDEDALDGGISIDTMDETGTITVQICIATYDNRIGVNIFNGDLTIDHKTYPVASFDDYETKCEKILNNLKKGISKSYPKYDFQFDTL